MISLSQNNKKVNFIEWIPTERGPIVTQYGKITIELNKTNLFYNILKKIHTKINIEKPVFSISIDSNNVFFCNCAFKHFTIYSSISQPSHRNKLVSRELSVRL